MVVTFRYNWTTQILKRILRIVVENWTPRDMPVRLSIAQPSIPRQYVGAFTHNLPNQDWPRQQNTNFVGAGHQFTNDPQAGQRRRAAGQAAYIALDRSNTADGVVPPRTRLVDEGNKIVSSDFVAMTVDRQSVGGQLALQVWHADIAEREYTEKLNTIRLVYWMRTEIWRNGQDQAHVGHALGGNVGNGGRNEQASYTPAEHLLTSLHKPQIMDAGMNELMGAFQRKWQTLR